MIYLPFIWKTQRDRSSGRPASASKGRSFARLAAILPFAGFLLPGAPAQAQEHFGTWLTDDRKAKIELRECGASGLCSEIVWLAEPLDENGKPWRDMLNPNPAKRSRPVIGIDVLKGLKKVGGQTWTGEIYDPEEGKFYYLKRIVVRDEKVEIRGCLPSGWPCRSKYWTRTTPVRQAEPQVAKAAPAEKPAPQQVAKPKPAPQPAARRQVASANAAPAPKPAPQPAQRSAPAPAPKPSPQQSAAVAAPAPAPRPQPKPQAQPQRQAAPVQRQASAPPPSPRPQPQRQAQPRQVQPQQAQPRYAQPRQPLPWQGGRVANAPSATGSVPQPMAAAPMRSGPAYLVQVTAGQDQNEALRTFGKLQRRYPRLLGGYLPNIQRVDLGPKGVWYRVRVGPMGQHTAALSFCQQLKAAGGDCLIRRE